MPTTTIFEQFQQRGGTAAALASVNAVPLVRQLVFETDTGKAKLGDGVTAYNSLAYISPPEQFAVAAGTADALTADFSPDIVLADGGEIRVRAAAANTGAATLAVDGGAARAITKTGGTALAAGDIAAAGHELRLRYRSSVPRWELLNPGAASASGQAAIQFKDEAVNVGSSGAITSLNVTGAGGALTVVGTDATLTLSGGGGGLTTGVASQLANIPIFL